MSSTLNFDLLKEYLATNLNCSIEQIQVNQLPGGYSNLSFLVQTPIEKLILRRPPFGEKIAKAHDMGREFAILKGLKKAGYTKSPNPVLYCEEEAIFGAPFFLMEFVEGAILRNQVPKGMALDKKGFEKLSRSAVNCLVELHQLELKQSGLIQLGKPEGFTQRQVTGWVDRYFRAKTKDLPELENVAIWLQENIPSTEYTAFIHNDFKYDNLVLDADDPCSIRSVLDWEMSTIGNPLMDLGTSLAYWAEEKDPEILKLFNLSHLPGNLSREELVDYYFSKAKRSKEEMIFYYVFGLFKVAAIAQQIFKRYSQGHSSDARFAQLIYVVEAAGKKAIQTLQTNQI
ncbi:MAG: phosphotransferase family protein [Bacteroidetes bacterium]|nr:phosphotransferase family protein [Bacteroidota bacterium]MDA1269403.1 phosphotransferase family protein [Bacteroidota bacterium]